MLMYDPITKSLEGIDDVTSVATGPDKFSGMCTAGGKVFAAPWNSDKMLMYDPITKRLEGIDVSSVATGKFPFCGMCATGEEDEEECVEDRVQKFVQKYSAMLLKFVAGSVRFMVEDVLNALCQLIFLVKCWPSNDIHTSFNHQSSSAQRAFTCISIAVGVALSIAGPLKDLRAMSHIRHLHKEVAGGKESEIEVDFDVREPLLEQGAPVDPEGEAQSQQPAAAQQADKMTPNPSDAALRENSSLPTMLENGRSQVQASAVAAKPAREQTPMEWRRSHQVTLSERSVADFLRGDDKKAKAAYHGLIAAGGFYWLAMALVPVLFGNKLGSTKSIPMTSLLYFILVTGLCILVEIWIVVHTRHGLWFIQNSFEHLTQAAAALYSCKLPSGAMASMAIILSLLGRYDTFADIVFTAMLFHEEEITWFSIRDVIFHLPMPLHQMSLIAVVVGVFACQALPGMILLAMRKCLPMAFKFNEFNLLLAITEYELDGTSAPPASSPADHV
eukprot:TRINITY_DN3696_c0_g1_i7.p1 TRINITY_DN3696_c0_g1~~TRINITY_DN3696_c0_g1_i7.p1  ORF type:complete len:502 (-),score=86.28 TRINITY_DN3696_c0_g1_i7:173-1678(-)